jgi:hypothetical protein
MATQPDDIPINVLGLLAFGSIIGTLVVVIMLTGLYRHREQLEFQRKVVDVPVFAVEAKRAAAAERLGNYGWVDRDQNVVHIPIDRAKALFLQEQRR